MSYRLIYSQSDCSRIIQSVLIDKRASVPEIKNQIGTAIKTFIDSQVAMVTDSTLFYKIETGNGNLAGYFTLTVVRTGVVSILQYELRPAFEQFSSEISKELANFINNGYWANDYL